MNAIAAFFLVLASGCADPGGELPPAGTEGGSDEGGPADVSDTGDLEFPPLVRCFDPHLAPENEYADPDDPRLADAEYEWARELLRETECAWCHVAEGSANQDAPPLWEVECTPAFTDSATDDTLAELSIAAGVNNLRGAASDGEVARLQDLLAAELERRAERRD